MGKYLARGHGVQTERSEVCAPCRAHHVVGPCGFFWPLSRKCVRPSYGTFINGLQRTCLQGRTGHMIISNNKKVENAKSVFSLTFAGKW